MSNTNTLLVGVSGVRGIVGPGINPAVVMRFTEAFGSRIAKGSVVVIGRDPRPSGPAIASAVSSTLRFMGISVVDLGIASTPTVEIMVEELGAAAGIVVTASHNGPEWNALKFLDSRGEFLCAAAMEDIEKRALGAEPPFDASASFGAAVANDTGDSVHIARILKLGRIDPERVAARRFKAVVDCVNGAGSRILPSLLRSLGLDVVELYTDIEAPFPHNPEPKPEHLGDLSKAVARERADIGFACDPDGDRLVLVDETGCVLSEELTLAIVADFVLKEEKGALVANLSTSRVIDDIGAARGATVYRSKVGEAHVAALMKETRAAIGGEGNGGVMYPKLHCGRDAMVGAALVLQSLAEEGLPLSKKAGSLPRYFIVKEKVALKSDFALAEKSLAKRFSGRVTTIDGIRIDMESGWVHLRKSNTEPVVRIIAEARSIEEARSLAKEAGSVL